MEGGSRDGSSLRDLIGDDRLFVEAVDHLVRRVLGGLAREEEGVGESRDMRQFREGVLGFQVG